MFSNINASHSLGYLEQWEEVARLYDIPYIFSRNTSFSRGFKAKNAFYHNVTLMINNTEFHSVFNYHNETRAKEKLAHIAIQNWTKIFTSLGRGI